jgi:hypothetical protein
MTDPNAARRAQHAANQRAYQARQKAAAATKKLRGATPHGGGVVQKAQADARAIREERDRILRQLPHAMSIDAEHPPEKAARIRPLIDTGRAEGPPIPKTKRAQQNRAAAIREQVNAERVQGIGKRRKADLLIELTDGPISEELQEMSREDRRRFQELAERIAAGSNQAIGILFEHAGGQKLYSAAIERIRYKPHRRDGFELLESLAEYAEQAARIYSPAAMKRLGLGDASGRLNI